MKYTEVIFTCNGEEWKRDLLINDLASLGFDTFENTSRGFNAYIASEQFDVVGLENLLLMLSDEFQVHYEAAEIAQQNWNTVWESNFEPITVGNNCRVRATFHPYEQGYEYDLIIDPKMAFGTGHHQTTTLMMEYILGEDMAGRTVLDMGCGTGILAILAVKRGANPLVAIDYDEVCYESTLENIKLNSITEAIEVRCGTDTDIPTHIKFDIILANINRNILSEHMQNYAAALKQGGKLFVSGFYEGDDLTILRQKAADLGFTYVNNKVLDTWAAAEFIKSE